MGSLRRTQPNSGVNFKIGGVKIKYGGVELVIRKVTGMPECFNSF